MGTTSLQRTPLFPFHQALGARFVSFAGWEMPLQYQGVVAEHRAVRERAGVFDISHMGKFE
ncbi:glycine cleavage system aminomethyltransferase GcvT, partial [Synechococcus sp. H60.3]